MSAVDECSVTCSAEQKIRALRSVASFPVPASSVEVIETHFAWVFLVGHYAYKMKKPVAHPLMDLRSLENRHRNCLAEVRVNRRLAPDVYLGVVPLVVDARGTVKVGVEGNAVDWLVWMKRLPATAMLDRAMADGSVNPAALAELGALLARFYDQQQRYFMPAREYLLKIIERTAMEGRALLAPELKLDGARVFMAVSAVDASFNSLELELGTRAVEGRVVECHGDLRPEHICLSPLCVIDSLEFSRELRVLDPAEELAFLRLECEMAGAAEIGDRIVDAYQVSSGDKFSKQLLYCYQACRALVRAKIIAWHILDPTVASLAPWTNMAHAYIDVAERYARKASRLLV